MHFPIVFAVFYIFVLATSLSWSWEMSHFRGVKSQFDELLCGMSPPNKTLTAVGSGVECLASCFGVCSSPCRAINYWNNAKLCEHFHYIPCSYAVQQDCANYKVIVNLNLFAESRSRPRHTDVL